MYKQLQQRGMDSPPVNVSTLRRMKAEAEPIACLTAYDASFAQLVDMAGMDLILGGQIPWEWSYRAMRQRFLSPSTM
ncbi:MAG: hypothetical protein CM1200mP36_09410 [Gammaproteobacteria bacterium]|nr:MAG: hypothetical protein CM1200mP36_09410 [Gammaproteobacteria bacterium]